MSDLISRKAAIETLHKLRVEQARKWNYSFRSLDEGRMEGAELAISIIENLGAAEPAIDGAPKYPWLFPTIEMGSFHPILYSVDDLKRVQPQKATKRKQL